MRTLRFTLLWSPALLLAGCLMSRLDTDAPDVEGDAGEAHGTAGSTATAGNDAGGKDSGGSNAVAGDGPLGGLGGVAGSDGGSAGKPNPGGAGGTAGAPATAGAGGVPEGGTSGTSNTGGTINDGGDPGVGGDAGAGGSGEDPVHPRDDLTKVWESDACGTGTPVSGAGTVNTTGEKDAICAATFNGQPRCGPWGQASSTWQTMPLVRNYHLYLPAGYVNTKAYPLVFQGGGCGAGAMDVYGLDNNANNTVIRVGLAPPPAVVGHGTNPSQGCFDEKEGDDSVEFVFYQTLYDKLNGQVCFDRNRVFASGNSSGAWLANELGCKYAGDSERPVRGIIPNTGGLPSEPAFKPTCTTKPMSGLWVHEIDDQTNPFSGNKYAIARAMMVNGCNMGTSYDTASFENYPVTGLAASDCRRMLGCPTLHPLIVCPINGNGHGSHDNIVNPAASKYLQAFLAPPFLVP